MGGSNSLRGFGNRSVGPGRLWSNADSAGRLTEAGDKAGLTVNYDSRLAQHCRSCVVCGCRKYMAL